jgi:iron complex outermembrane receptor protein
LPYSIGSPPLRRFLSASLIAIAAAAPVGVRAQDAAPAEPAAQADPAPTDDGTFSENEIVVIAGRLPGEVVAPQPPILELNEEDIASYGAGSLSELLDALSTVTGSGRGRGSGPPVFLVNGMRVSSFREMQSYPPEALKKVEVLSEEVAQQFGYSPDQRVINFILKDNFQSRELEVEYEQPDKGGYSQKEVEATYLLIDGQSRLNLNAEANDTSLLTEAERGVIQAESSIPGLATDPDPADYRSLVSDSAGYELNGTWTTKLSDNGTSVSVNGAFERSDRRSLQGLDSVLLTDPGGETMLRTLNSDDPIEVRSRTDTYSLGSTLNLPLGDWQLTGTVDANFAKDRSQIDRYADTSGLVAAAAAGDLALDADLDDLPDAAFDEARSKTYTINSLVTAIGHPLELPAGEVSLTLDGGARWNGIDSQDTRNPGVETSLDRRRLSAGANIGIPLIAGDMEGIGELIGDLSLNLNAGLDHLSDFGTLTDWTAGINWGPTEKLNFNASYIARDDAPTLTQLGAAEIATPNVPVYDLSRGETVLATVITGGNPNLPKQKQRDWKIGVSWETPLLENSRLTIDYFKNHSEDVASGFPLLTPEIEAAFPDRVERDIQGRLVSIDQRPVTFAETNSQRLQIGLNFSGPLGKPRPDAQNGGRGGPGGGFFFGGPSGPGGAPGGQGGAGPGQFNPQAFEAVRGRFCMPEMANAVPTAEDLAGLPEFLVNNLKKDDGTIDPAKWAEFKGRLCSAEGSIAGGGGFNPQRFAQMRQQFCTDANTERLPTPEQLAALPEQLVSRLKKDDGTIDPERWKAFRERICAAPTPGGQGQGRQGSGQGQGGQGPVFVFAGPPGGGPPPGAGQGGGGGFRGGGGGFRGGGGPLGGGGGGNGQGRWFFGLNHTIELSSTVLIADGLPELDLLEGDALASAQPRHSTNFRLGGFYRGFGGNIAGTYTGSSRIDGSGLPGSTDLIFNDIIKFDVRLFVDLNQQAKLIEDMPLLKNTRISFSIDNVFDARQRVVDSNGEVPLRYQPYLIDPVGRFIGVELRKMF